MSNSITAALKVGAEAEISVKVTNAQTAPEAGSGSVAVLATPSMVALMEGAAVATVEPHLPPGYATLGTEIDVKHVAATPPGLAVWARARLVAVDGRKLTFEIEARDDLEVIGRAKHTRIIVDRARFDAKVARKLETAPLSRRP